ncbi:MAG: formate dehydrogenase accessory sulfurtransferase FdhD [Gemmata sp.]
MRALTLTCGGPGAERDDTVAVEAPLEVRIGGRAVTVLMRTPGTDAELVMGFLFGEGVIADADDVLSIERPTGASGPDRENVLEVWLAVARRPVEADRLFFSNSSCGLCGKRTLDSVEVRAAPVSAALTVSRDVLSQLPPRLRASQPAFGRTGGAHASGLFTAAGELLAVREDVGRHNALDKLVGWALDQGRVPLAEFVLLVSGRVSYELVQKAVTAGIPVVAAVGAPSSLAVALAQRFGVTLVGFLRETSLNVYAHAHRITE